MPGCWFSLPGISASAFLSNRKGKRKWFLNDNGVVAYSAMALLKTISSRRRPGDRSSMMSSCARFAIPASRDYGVYPATERSHWDVDQFTGEQRSVTYAERFSKQYQQFKAQQQQTKAGTPLDYLTFLTEGKRAELRALNIYTAEALAIVDGAELKNLGPGGREMKNKTIEFLETAARRRRSPS